MGSTDNLQNLRKMLGLDDLKEEVLPPKLCIDKGDLCAGKEATNLEDSVLLKESIPGLADMYYVCLIEKQEDWNNDLETVECIFEPIPTCSHDNIDECVCVYGGGEDRIFQGETCDQECLEGDCVGETFCRDGDIECIVSHLNNKHENTDYYEGHSLINQGSYSEISMNKEICLIDLLFQRTNHCDEKEPSGLIECGKQIFDVASGQYITPTNDCVCYYTEGNTKVSLIPPINENSSDLCLGKILPYYGPGIGELQILTNFKVSSDCENYQGCADYNTGNMIQELFKEELCSEDPCMFGTCSWNGNACI